MPEDRIHCFTSFSFSYLSKARVLGKTLKRHHPDWHLWAVISDREPQGFLFDASSDVFDKIIWSDELFGDETPAWLFNHDVVELCTAVKGPILAKIMKETDAQKVFYFDPDIAVFNSLQPLANMLDEHSILLTPHQLEPNDGATAILDNEICSLRLGTYNLGFVGVRRDSQGLAFADWWAKCLEKYCYDDPANGLFVDQKWCDLVPALFDGVKIVRDPGYNVASWNLSRRKVSITHEGQILVNGSPLRFFHFTKLGPIGDIMTQRYARENVEVYELWRWYKHQVDLNQEPSIPRDWWKYGSFSNGHKIRRSDRTLYRTRQDLRTAFRNPFKADEQSYYAWLCAHGRVEVS
jgi:hypothetical protein